MKHKTPHALVFGDVNLNIIDGSAIWAQSMVEALSRAGARVTLVLKARVETDRLVAPLERLPNVRVVRSVEEKILKGLAKQKEIPPGQVPAALAAVDQRDRADLLVIRGLRAVSNVARDGHFDGRMWTYLTDVPQSPSQFTEEHAEKLDLVARSSRLMLCQTDELRAFLETMAPAACGKSELWNPVVPDIDFDLPDRSPVAGRPIRMTYSGKYAPLWNTLQMCDLPRQLQQAGVSAELDMIGDKVHWVPADPDYQPRMRAALETSPGVHWRGGMPRRDAMMAAAEADVGMSWRDPELDASLELSTKLLEYGSLRLPILLNRTPMHEELFGADYPLFVASAEDIVSVLQAAVADPSLFAVAAERTYRASRAYTMTAAAQRMRYLLRKVFPTADAVPALAGRSAPLRVCVASHDLKFFTRILDHYRALDEVDVRVDHWETLHAHDEAESLALRDWADVVIAEWAGPNAVWYSRNKRPGQRLICRLHRFELGAGWLANIDFDAIDQLVCVSPHYAMLTRETTGWDPARIVVVPNWVDIEQFSRAKLGDVRFSLGMIGIAPSRKRMDLGVEVLGHLRRRDPRYRLSVKSKMPWEYWWIWNKPEEQTHFDELFARLATDPVLSDAVVFDPYGADVANWLRRIGWVLSTSDDESFHLAPAEGMAGGAVPAILPWPGSDTIYDPRWISPDVETMADRIDEIVRGGRWEEESVVAARQVAASFPLRDVVEDWTRILVTDVDPDKYGDTLARG